MPLLESTFQIPVNDKGFITSYRRDDFSKKTLKCKRYGYKDNPASQVYRKRLTLFA
jgi:hypothetical protein